MNSFVDQIEQVDRDLAEIDVQVAVGELDSATATRLRAAYEEERAALVEAEVAPPQSDTGRSPQRTLVGGLILGVGIIAIAVFAVVSLQDDSPGAEVSGGVATDVLAGNSGVDLSQVTTEEMEAVVAANPTIVGMRLALAGRYVDAGDHSTALDHYLTVLDQDPEQPEALAMVGWLSFLAGEAQLAEPFVTKALDIEPDYPLAWWFLANVKVANGDSAAAADAIRRLLAFDLSAETRAEAERFLAELPS
jgi:cytochrome c-type biogenesis protein CcmH/NrfG